MQFQTLSQVQEPLDFLPLLKDGVLFKNIADSELKAICQAATRNKYQKDDYLFHEDEPANTISVLVEGAIHLSQLTPKGQQVIMHYLSPGDEIGILALFPDQVYPVTAVAATECITLTWSRQTLSSLIQKYPQLTLNALEMMTQRFVVLQNQYRQLATERVEQRIARIIMQIAEKTGQDAKHGIRLTPPPSRQQIAEMAGATLFTVSRICSQWEKDGLVHTNRRSLLIKDAAALAKIVDNDINQL